MKGAVYRPHHASDPNYGKPPCLSNNDRSNASHSPLLRRSKRPPEAPPSRRLEQELAWYSFRFGFDAAPFALVNIFVVLTLDGLRFRNQLSELVFRFSLL